MSLRTLPLLAALLLSLVPIPAVAQMASPAPVYHWHSLVLRHVAPSGVLNRMHWGIPDPLPNPFIALIPPETRPPGSAPLPVGVRRLFALRGNNSLLAEATDDGYDRLKALVRPLDVAARQARMTMLFVAVPSARAASYTSDMKAALLLPQLLNGEASVDQPPTVAASEDQTVSVPCGLAPGGRFRMISAGTADEEAQRGHGGSWLSSPPQSCSPRTSTLTARSPSASTTRPRTLQTGPRWSAPFEVARWGFTK